MPENEKAAAEKFTAVMRKAASADEMSRLSEVFEVGKIFMFRRFQSWLEKQKLNDAFDAEGLLPTEVCADLLEAMDVVGPDPCPLARFVDGIRQDAEDDVRDFGDWLQATGTKTCVEGVAGAARGTFRPWIGTPGWNEILEKRKAAKAEGKTNGK